jgi:DNA-binding NarL/FixJ family response regulator
MNVLIIDDHPLMLNSIKQLVQAQFIDAKVTTVSTATAASQLLANRPNQWQLVLSDLSIPNDSADVAKSETGIELLRTIMNLYPDLNLMVYSNNLKGLVQLKQQIDNHQGGFTIADKISEPVEIQRRMQYAIEGITLTKEIRKGIELKPEWLQTLQLATQGLQDKAISEQLNVTERSVRHYWTKLQDVLGIYVHKSDRVNPRILTLNRAREEGLIQKC